MECWIDAMMWRLIWTMLEAGLEDAEKGGGKEERERCTWQMRVVWRGCNHFVWLLCKMRGCLFVQ